METNHIGQLVDHFGRHHHASGGDCKPPAAERVTVFVTDTHADGSYTVFMPTGPNPTSGNIYHLQAENVYPVDVPVEDAMRSIISCGAGSSALVNKFNEKDLK